MNSPCFALAALLLLISGTARGDESSARIFDCKTLEQHRREERLGPSPGQSLGVGSVYRLVMPAWRACGVDGGGEPGFDLIVQFDVQVLELQRFEFVEVTAQSRGQYPSPTVTIYGAGGKVLATGHGGAGAGLEAGVYRIEYSLFHDPEEELKAVTYFSRVDSERRRQEAADAEVARRNPEAIAIANSFAAVNNINPFDSDFFLELDLGCRTQLAGNLGCSFGTRGGTLFYWAMALSIAQSPPITADIYDVPGGTARPVRVASAPGTTFTGYSLEVGAGLSLQPFKGLTLRGEVTPFFGVGSFSSLQGLDPDLISTTAVGLAFTGRLAYRFPETGFGLGAYFRHQTSGLYEEEDGIIGRYHSAAGEKLIKRADPVDGWFSAVGVSVIFSLQ